MKNEKNIFLIVTISIVIGFFLGTFFQKPDIVYPTNAFSHREITLAAVDSDGSGIAIPLKAEILYGDGKILTDIDKLLFWVDTQYSIQTARDVARNVTGIDTSQYDIIYSIASNETGVVGGPSAGAALTVVTIAALTNRTIRDDVVMTGTINQDGTIGQVGGVLEKAEAAKDIGAKLFLVPYGQGTETKIIPQQVCTRDVGLIYCETKYEQETTNIGEKVGIAVIEIKTINDATKYFFE